MSSNKAGRRAMDEVTSRLCSCEGGGRRTLRGQRKKQETSSARNAGPFSLNTMKVPKLGFSFLETRSFRSQA